MQCQFIMDNSETFPVEEICEVFGLSRSGYYAWRDREPCARQLEDEHHKSRICELYDRAKGRYGHRPIYEHLKDEGIACGRDRTLRLMKEAGIEGVQRKGFKAQSTDSDHQFGCSPNLLRELGSPQSPDRVWVADTTYLKTHAGWAYLATVMDLFSRRIIGWSVSQRNDSSLVCQALRSALLTRGGRVGDGLVHHSDRGSTYASYEYQRLLERNAMEQSMSAKGNCYDNAAMESFYGRYKTSSARDYVFENEAEVRSNAFEYIEIFYNRFRKHASLGYKSPMQVEENFCPPGGDGLGIPACLNNN